MVSLNVENVRFRQGKCMLFKSLKLIGSRENSTYDTEPVLALFMLYTVAVLINHNHIAKQLLINVCACSFVLGLHHNSR